MLLAKLVKTIKRKAHRGDQAVTTDQITADIIECINESAREIQRLLPKRFWLKQGTLAFTVGTQGTPQNYSLPSDCQDLSAISYTISSTYYFMYKIESDREWLSQIWNPSVSPNRPLYYREIGPDANGNKQIEVFPMSNFAQNVNIEYYKLKSADLDSTNLNSNVPDIPDQYQDCLEKGGLYKFLKGFDDPMQGKAEEDYKEALMAAEIGDERDSAGNLKIRLGTLKYELPGFRFE